MNSDNPSLHPELIPHHLAIIMDGNGRWAKKRSLNRIRGHQEGVKSVRDIVTACREIGIKVLTLYAFSTENWQRPKEEVSALMNFLKVYLKAELPQMMKNGIRLNAIGEIEQLPDDVQAVLSEVMQTTKQNRSMLLNLALNYGGRDEIIMAVRKIATEVEAGRLQPDEITKKTFSNYLYTHGMPEPDLLIRTSGEMRISNFLLWQIAYTEIFVTRTLWPDFRRRELFQILLDYQKRERRFGMTGEQIRKREAVS
ncbi:MAG: isoprenyl transferase [Deltaproteobacteria bacterium]|nr:isoprenyl transferase [Deltaproteobacteria bacterium]RLB90175.1 MAG: isoprenyl transferase [Deltaproteobacteria bacterium]RLB96248.1 MAG: isoprenyl transferase [Deltaproteobacteria bacterium]RLC12112.1 MAG: isoprenyl transferase [Deltaproteobacteria bacterium]